MLNAEVKSFPWVYAISNDRVTHFRQRKINMVCAKCQKLQKSTELATPGVKRKNELYYGSPASSSNGGDKSKSSATLGSTGICKVKTSFRFVTEEG